MDFHIYSARGIKVVNDNYIFNKSAWLPVHKSNPDFKTKKALGEIASNHDEYEEYYPETGIKVNYHFPEQRWYPLLGYRCVKKVEKIRFSCSVYRANNVFVSGVNLFDLSVLELKTLLSQSEILINEIEDRLTDFDKPEFIEVAMDRRYTYVSLTALKVL